MAYRMHRLTDRVRVGINAAGELNIEIDPDSSHAEDAPMEEVFIPADAVPELADFLRRHQ